MSAPTFSVAYVGRGNKFLRVAVSRIPKFAEIPTAQPIREPLAGETSCGENKARLFSSTPFPACPFFHDARLRGLTDRGAKL
jgi:hypothetical protein